MRTLATFESFYFRHRLLDLGLLIDYWQSTLLIRKQLLFYPLPAILIGVTFFNVVVGDWLQS